MNIAFVGFYALHVLCGIAWFGGALFSLLVLGPALSGVNGGVMAEIGPRIGAQAGKVMPVAGIASIVLGVATAFATGRFATVQSALSDAYGRTALVALLLAIATYLWAKYVVEERVGAMQSAPPSEKPHAFSRLMQGIAIEQAGFLAILACMVSMRFGY